MEDFSSVKTFAFRAERLDRLDAAIMNANLAPLHWHTTVEGWERQMQVNVLSTAFSSLFLLPSLVRIRTSFPESRPHLTILGSDIHLDAKFEERNSESILDTLNAKLVWEKTSRPGSRNSLTKLFDLNVGNEIAALVPRTDDEPAVIVNVVNPSFYKFELIFGRMVVESQCGCCSPSNRSWHEQLQKGARLLSMLLLVSQILMAITFPAL